MGIDEDVRAQIDLVTSSLDVVPEIQIRGEDGQVAGERALVFRQDTLPFAGCAAATSAVPTATARRRRVLRVAAGPLVIRCSLSGGRGVHHTVGELGPL